MKMRSSNGPRRRSVSVRATSAHPTAHPTARGRRLRHGARADAERTGQRRRGQHRADQVGRRAREPDAPCPGGIRRSTAPAAPAVARARRPASASQAIAVSESSSSSTSGLTSTVTGRVTSATPWLQPRPKPRFSPRPITELGVPAAGHLHGCHRTRRSRPPPAARLRQKALDRILAAQTSSRPELWVTVTSASCGCRQARTAAQPRSVACDAVFGRGGRGHDSPLSRYLGRARTACP